MSDRRTFLKSIAAAAAALPLAPSIARSVKAMGPAEAVPCFDDCALPAGVYITYATLTTGGMVWNCTEQVRQALQRGCSWPPVFVCQPTRKPESPVSLTITYLDPPAKAGMTPRVRMV